MVMLAFCSVKKEYTDFLWSKNVSQIKEIKREKQHQVSLVYNQKVANYVGEGISVNFLIFTNFSSFALNV